MTSYFDNNYDVDPNAISSASNQGGVPQQPHAQNTQGGGQVVPGQAQANVASHQQAHHGTSNVTAGAHHQAAAAAAHGRYTQQLIQQGGGGGGVAHQPSRPRSAVPYYSGQGGGQGAYASDYYYDSDYNRSRYYTSAPSSQRASPTYYQRGQGGYAQAAGYAQGGFAASGRGYG